MKKNLIKAIALAVAGAIIPVYAYISGAADKINSERDAPEENEEDVAADTQ